MIPVLIPSLPETDAIIPYLRRIDQSHIYSNYGPLSRAFTETLCRFVSEARRRRAGGGDDHRQRDDGHRTRPALPDRRPDGPALLMPAYTFVATAHAAVNVGLEPFFADVDPETLALTPTIAARALAAAGTRSPPWWWSAPTARRSTSPPGKRSRRRTASRWCSTPPPPRSTCTAWARSRSA